MTGFVHRLGLAFYGPHGIRFRRLRPGAWSLETSLGVVARDLATLDDALAAASRLVNCAQEATRLLGIADDPGDLAAQIRDEDAVRDLAELIFHADPDMEVALAKLVTSTITPAVTHALRARPDSPLARSKRTG